MVGDLIAGRYELEELVGTGGMSSVFRARDRLLERTVALKVLHEHFARDEDSVERFRREARAVAQLSHPNIVTVIDRGDQDGRQFIVFEYIEGENLKELVARRGPLPVREAIEIVLQVARALAFAHQQGLVHRDVKPQNVLLNGDGRAKVTDFGIARAVDVKGLTQTGTVLGTSEYIAPEQARGLPVDAKTDIYALAVVLYELLTAEVPFAGENFVAVALRHVNEPAPSVLERRPDVPVRLAALLGRALEKEPARRFASMDELVGELERCLGSLGRGADEDPTMIVPGGAIPAPRTRRPPRRRRPWTVTVSVLAVTAAAAAAAAVLVLRDSGGPSGGGPPPAGAVHLAGVGSYDPAPGDGAEHNEAVARATDGDPATYWTTETYRSFSYKKGVGLVLDAGKPADLTRLTVTTDTPGFTAEIQAGDSPAGPFLPVSASETVGPRTVFALAGGTPARYYVVWITSLDGVAHVDEVTAG